MGHSDLSICWAILFGTFWICLAYTLRTLTNGRLIADRVERDGGSILLSKWLMEMGYWVLSPLSRLAVQTGVSANTISYFALVSAALAGGFLAMGRLGWAALFGIAGGALDALDGMVARSTGTMSFSGKILDSALDRYVEFFLFAGLFVHFHPNFWQELLTLAALFGSLMVSYSTALGEISQTPISRGSMRRADRLVYLLAAIVLTPLIRSGTPNLPLLLVLALIAFAANLSAILRIRKIRMAVKTREERVISMTLAQVRSVRASTRTDRRSGTE